jgi:protein gp37
MGKKTNIGWTHHTFNPWRGCAKVSPGCAHCYAEAMAKRDPAILGTWGKEGRRIIASESSDTGWRAPVKWNRAAEQDGQRRRVFCASLADVFEDRPDLVAPRARLFRLIRQTPSLDWLLLTKWAERIGALLPPDWCDGYPNVWLGVSIESNDFAGRADHLRAIPAAVRFISYEPALGPLDRLDLAGLDWVIYGGESGPKRREEDKQWARDMRDRCRAAGVKFFHKQSAALYPEQGRELDGQLIEEYPVPRRLPLPVVQQELFA